MPGEGLWALDTADGAFVWAFNYPGMTSNRWSTMQSEVGLLGDNESGAVVFGGCAAITTALLWTRLFPDLARADRFENIEEQAVSEKPQASA